MQSHPLKIYAQAHRVTFDQIAVAANTSRMTLSRVMRGENTTLDLLSRISDATGGEVTMRDLVGWYDASRIAGRHEKSAPRVSRGAAL